MDLRNPSHLAELIPHHEHTSLDGLSPVDILKPADDRCLSQRPPKCSVPQAMTVPLSSYSLCSSCYLPWHASSISMCSASRRRKSSSHVGFLLPAPADMNDLCCSRPMYAAVGTAQETVFLLDGARAELAAMQAIFLRGFC